MSTSIRFNTESISGHCEKPRKWIGDGLAANLYLLFEIENLGSKKLKIHPKEIEISVKNTAGALIVVEESRYANGKFEMIIPAKATRAIKAQFRIPNAQFLLLQQEISDFTITILGESCSVPLPSARIVDDLIKWPE